MPAVRLVEYCDSDGRSPYARWFDRLNGPAAARVARSLYRLEGGNFSNVEGVGAGVFELKIDFGPGYRAYFGKQGDLVVVLLGGSSKRDQQEAIRRAQAAWASYKRRKQQDT